MLLLTATVHHITVHYIVHWCIYRGYHSQCVQALLPDRTYGHQYQFIGVRSAAQTAAMLLSRSLRRPIMNCVHSSAMISASFYRAMHYSAKRGLAIARRPSFRL